MFEGKINGGIRGKIIYLFVVKKYCIINWKYGIVKNEVILKSNDGN